MNSSSAFTSAISSRPSSANIVRAALSASTGRAMSWSASKIVTRSYRSGPVNSAASPTRNRTRSATSDDFAFARAVSTPRLSRSMPSTSTSGYASAIAMPAHPVPQPMSAMRAGGSERNRWSSSPSEGSHRSPRRLRKIARLVSTRPSGSQGSGGGAPAGPVRGDDLGEPPPVPSELHRGSPREQDAVQLVVQIDGVHLQGADGAAEQMLG
nr:hypothetical protein [Planotetraspora kaengkrachanensis]